MEPTVPPAPATVVPADYPELGRLAWRGWRILA